MPTAPRWDYVVYPTPNVLACTQRQVFRHTRDGREHGREEDGATAASIAVVSPRQTHLITGEWRRISTTQGAQGAEQIRTPSQVSG
mmetsp:Transcript_27633/g.72834  ORF Transcript_27633/g.72834 Transcript_27633/m.72834 type:complete len:86 (+) Transcript_27633:260-517(+)